jgi:hypothetical protein
MTLDGLEYQEISEVIDNRRNPRVRIHRIKKKFNSMYKMKTFEELKNLGSADSI